MIKSCICCGDNNQDEIFKLQGSDDFICNECARDQYGYEFDSSDSELDSEEE